MELLLKKFNEADLPAKQAVRLVSDFSDDSPGLLCLTRANVPQRLKPH
jgi:hypothetical protein